MRAIFNVGKNKAQSITPKKRPNTTRQCIASHLCSQTDLCLSSFLYLRRPQAGSATGILYLWFTLILSMKWHTVSIKTSRGSFYKRKIYRNRIISFYLNFTLQSPVSCPIIIIYINVQNTHAPYTDLPLASSFPTTFRVYPSGSLLVATCDFSVKTAPNLVISFPGACFCTFN